MYILRDLQWILGGATNGMSGGYKKQALFSREVFEDN